MQQYAQRALQARVRDAGIYMADQSNAIGTSKQYEPYYQKSDYRVTRDSTEHKISDGNIVSQDLDSDRARVGAQTTEYNGTFTATNSAMPTGI